MSLSIATTNARPISLVRTALDGLRMAAIAYYRLRRPLVMKLETQNFVVASLLDAGHPLSARELCQLLAAGIAALAEDPLAGTEWGQDVLNAGRDALAEAERAGLYRREVS